MASSMASGARQSDENQLATVKATKNIGLPVNLPKIYFSQGWHTVDVI